jgi:hypothetical protein
MRISRGYSDEDEAIYKFAATIWIPPPHNPRKAELTPRIELLREIIFAYLYQQPHPAIVKRVLSLFGKGKDNTIHWDFRKWNEQPGKLKAFSDFIYSKIIISWVYYFNFLSTERSLLL